MKKVKATQVSISMDEVPGHIPNPKKYMEGFEHGLYKNTLNIEQMKTSFRLGFRAAKLYLKQNGMVQPSTYSFKIKSTWENDKDC